MYTEKKYTTMKEASTAVKARKRAGSTTDGQDQDSNPSFETDSESECNQDEEEEDCVEYMKRRTREAEETMQSFKIKSWVESPKHSILH